MPSPEEISPIPTRCFRQDCQLNIDIILKSSENDLFGAHRQNLGCFSEGFPSEHTPTIEVLDDPVQLTEDSKTLDLILQFMHLDTPPELDDLRFEELDSLGDAARKYIIHHLIPLVDLHMRRFLETDPANTLIYAYKHDLEALQADAAYLCLKRDLTVVHKTLKSYPILSVAQAKYFNECRSIIIDRIRDRPKSQKHQHEVDLCEEGLQHLQDVVIRYGIFENPLTAIEGDTFKLCLTECLLRYPGLQLCRHCKIKDMIYSWPCKVKALAPGGWGSGLPKWSDIVRSVEETEFDASIVVELLDRAAVFRYLQNPPSVADRGGNRQCEHWNDFYTALLLDCVDAAPSSADDFKQYIKKSKHLLQNCKLCLEMASEWHKRWRRQLGDHMERAWH